MAGRVINAELHRGFVVVAEFFEAGEHRRGNFCAAERGDAFGLARALDGQDAREDGHGDAEFFDEVIAELEEIGIVEKKLGDDEIRAAINLVLEPGPIHVFALLAGDVALGKTGGADGKAAQFADVADELVGKLEAALGFFEHAVAAGRIAAQGEDVFDAERARLGNDFADLLLACD